MKHYLKSCSEFLRFSLSLLFVLLFVLTGTGFSEEKPIKWRLQHLWAQGRVDEVSIVRMCSKIKEMSNGRLEIQTFTPDALVPSTETFDAISRGVFEAHVIATAYLAGKAPVFSLFYGVPGGFERPEDYQAWLWQKGGMEIAREVYAKYNIYPVGYASLDHSWVQCFTKSKEIKTITDYKGLKIRALPGLPSKSIAAIGASPVMMPMGDVYTAFESGVIDAVSGYSINGWKSFGMAELAKYMIMPGWAETVVNMEFSVNMKAWNSLPQDLKAIVQMAAREWHDEYYSSEFQINARDFNEFKIAGLKAVVFPQEEVLKIREISRKVVDEWAAKDETSNKTWLSIKEYLSFLEQVRK